MKAYIAVAVIAAVILCPFFVPDSDAESKIIPGDGFQILYVTLTEPSGSAHGTAKIGQMDWTYSDELKPLVIPETVEISGKTYDVTEIESLAFRSWNISSIVLPSTIAKIGEGAFSYCDRVTEIHFNSNPEIGKDAFSLGYQNRPADCNIYGFTPTRPVGEDGNPYEDIFGKYTTVHYKEVSFDSRDAIIHIALISLGIAALFFMGRSVRVKKIKRKKRRA